MQRSDNILNFANHNESQLTGILGEAQCNETANLFTLPSWHEHLYKRPDYEIDASGAQSFSGTCSPVIDDFGDVLLILLSIVEMLLRISMYAAIVMIIYGGITFAMSQGVPERIQKAKKTVLYASLGLAISLMASTVIIYGARLL